MQGNEEGAAAVELALVLPILVLLIFGAVQFGMFFFRAQGLQASVREGARVAATGASFDDIQTRVFAEADTYFDTAHITVTTDPASSGADAPCGSAGELVTVKAEVAPDDAYAITIPFVTKRQVTFTSEGAFRCERSG